MGNLRCGEVEKVVNSGLYQKRRVSEPCEYRKGRRETREEKRPKIKKEAVSSSGRGKTSVQAANKLKKGDPA